VVSSPSWWGAEEEGLDAPATAEDGRRWAGLLEQAANILDRRTGAGYRPLWAAPAGKEAAEAHEQLCPDGTTRWGPLPYQQVWTAYTVLARTLVEHSRAMALLLRSDPKLSMPLETQARVMVEIAAQASWLTWPGLGGRARVARLQVLRRASALQHDHLAAFMTDPADSDSTTGEPDAPALVLEVGAGHNSSDRDNPATVADLNVYAETLGLAYNLGPKGVWNVEGQPAQRATRRAKWFFEVLSKETPAAFYPYLCGAAHGELWRLIQNYRATGRDDDGTETWEPWPARIFTRFAVILAVEALVYTGRLGFALLGSGAGIAELRAFRPTAVRELARDTET